MNSETRLRNSNDIRTLFRTGRRIEARYFLIVYRANEIGHLRTLLVVSRAVDKRAVVRNRLRRRTKEFLRVKSGYAQKAIDIAVTFKKEAVKAPKKEFYEELSRGISKIG